MRSGLCPRDLLTVWPDLNPDVGTVLATLPEEGSAEFVWEAQDGTIRHAVVDDTEYQELATLVADARAACALPMYIDERHPLRRPARQRRRAARPVVTPFTPVGHRPVA
ncbi:hypothetical protein ACIRCZ_20365 [Leifsonia sp. NPDC102414]|uniref:hypothetical protein n=1 Tax=Leifsonia sp. NPDC102414 TaxID=3364124 RepID=UPI0037FEF689